MKVSLNTAQNSTQNFGMKKFNVLQGNLKKAKPLMTEEERMKLQKEMIKLARKVNANQLKARQSLDEVLKKQIYGY